MGGGLSALEQILQIITAASTPTAVPRIPHKWVLSPNLTVYILIIIIMHLKIKYPSIHRQALIRGRVADEYKIYHDLIKFLFRASRVSCLFRLSLEQLDWNADQLFLRLVVTLAIDEGLFCWLCLNRSSMSVRIGIGVEWSLQYPLRACVYEHSELYLLTQYFYLAVYE